MKPGIPWSVKGIEPEAREAAKLAARKAGLTLGEWLNSVIFDQSAHIVSGQVDSHPWENFVSSPPPSDTPRSDIGTRPPAPRIERRDDSALRLQDIAQQLAELAQRERHSAPAPQPGRAADREEFERIFERIDENERQTVEALSAVNERLSMLARQITQLGRPAGLERPEDVPGYPALESAIRSVVEHIEVSEKRTRDSLRSMQDRLAEVAEQRSAPSGEDLLRAAPVLSGLESRLADLVNRIQRSEGLMTERIEGVRSTAQQMANQAQASAVTALRGELREVETRMLASLKEAQAAAANAPSVVATEIARLHGDMAGLSRRFEDLKSGAASERDVQSLRAAIEQLSARVAQGPDLRPLADMDRRLGDINRRLEQAAAASRDEPQVSALEHRIAELDHRLAEAIRLQGDQQAMHRLEDSISAVSDRVARTEDQLGHLETMEHAIRQLHDSLEQTRGSMAEAAEAAATRALERYQPSQPAVAGPSPELQALEDGLRAIRESAVTADRRNRDTFEAVHETLAEIVDKIAELEAAPRAAASPSPSPPAAEAVQEAAPASAETAGTRDDGPVAPEQEPLSGSDDFIAAARRAAQAAATRPSALRAEYAVLTQAAAERKPSKLSFLQRLRARRGETAPKPMAESATDAAEPAKKPGSNRRTLILAGIVVLVAATYFAWQSLSAPSAPAVKQSGSTEIQVTPGPLAAPAKMGLQVEPPDPIVTASLPAPPLAEAIAASQSAALDMPPPQAGTAALRTAAASGNARAQFIVAGRFLDGQGVGQDFGKALFWYQQAATRGLAPAQYRLATLYELGKGTAADPKQALVWYERAALGGNVKAMHNAAVLLAGNKAGPADYDRAFRWFKAAAERGFADSQFNLAILYERGLGTPPSAEEAYVWYSLSARQGDADSAQRAAAIARKLPEVDRKAAGARLAGWSPTPSDDSANVVTVIDPAWSDRPAAANGRSS